MQWIEVNGTALRYEVSGEGAVPLVLVHEMGGTLESWDHVLPALLPGRVVVRHDWRGAGQSEKLAEPVTFQTMAGDIAALLDAIGISGRVALAGCAVGAGIALTFAGMFPERAAAVVAMAPATGMVAERRGPMLERVAATVARGMAASVEESFASSYPPEVRHDAEHYREFRARWIANDPVSYGNIYRMLIHAELGEVLGRIVCPVLAVAGTLDRLRPPAVVEPIAAEIPGARFVAVESGHFMAVQTPGVVADVMNGFLRPLGC
jgi:3-oxoadipate enol-lactonase